MNKQKLWIKLLFYCFALVVQAAIIVSGIYFAKMILILIGVVAGILTALDLYTIVICNIKGNENNEIE